MMNAILSLNLPAFNKYYLLQNDLRLCPEILNKFKNFLDHFAKKEFLGYIEEKDSEELTIEEGVKIIYHPQNY